MSPSFETRPFLVRRAGTATLHGTIATDWTAELGSGLHLLCVIAASVVARAVANQEVLDAVGPESLGSLYITVALLAGSVLALFGWLSRAEDARKLAVFTHAGIAAIMGLCALVPPRFPFAALVKYVSMELAAAVLLLMFGLLLGRRFAPREARKAAARIGAGGILGGLAAGGILSAGAPLLGSRWLFFVAAFIALVPLAWLFGIDPGPRLAERRKEERERPESPHLAPFGRSVAATTVIMVAATTLIDYQFRFSAKHWYRADELTAFFGYVVLLAGVVTVLFQLTLLDRLLDRLGLFVTASVMPAALIVAGAIFGFFPAVGTLVFLKLVDSGANMSVQQATGSLLLAPLGTTARSVWQSRIDGLAKRGGQALVGLFLALCPWPPSRVLPVTLALCGAWIVALAITRGRYIRLLTDMVRDAPEESPELRVTDGETVRLLEAELEAASPARASVILDLLADSGHCANPRALAHLDTEGPHGPGALLAIDHLARFGEAKALLAYAHHPRPRVAVHALTAMARLDLSAAQRFARPIVLDEAASAPVRAAAAALLAGAEPQLLRALRGFTQASDPETRLAVASALAASEPGGPQPLGEVLATLAQDPNAAVACRALESLARHPSTEGVETALEALRRRATRTAAMRALAALGPIAVERVSQELVAEREHPRIAATLAWVLGRLGTASAIPALVSALSNSHVEVRLAAAIALNSLHRRRPEVELPHETLSARHLPEIAYHAHIREMARSYAPSSPVGCILKSLFKQRSQASLECVFRLLALRYPEDAIRGALFAVSSGDRRQRQIALELLDSMVEPEVRYALAQMENEFGRKRSGEPLTMLTSAALDGDHFMAALARKALSEMNVTVHLADKEREIRMSDTLVQDILELQAVSLFAQSSAEDLAELATLLTERTVEKGALLFREGDPGDALYLVRAGRVTLSRRGELVEQVGPGDAFGIVAVLDQKSRELTAVAATDCELRLLAADDLLQLLGERPLFMHSVFRALTHSIRAQLDRTALGRRSEAAVESQAPAVTLK